MRGATNSSKDSTCRTSSSIANAEFLGRIRSQLRQRDLAEKLRASERRYRRLFESAKDGILILDAATGMVVDVNPFLVDLLGFSREVFLGEKVWELGFLKDIVADEASFAELQEKEYIRLENRPLEAADGHRIEVEFVSTVHLVDGQKVIQCNIRDITERKASERALRQSEERLAGIVNSAMDAIISIDARQCVVLFNAAAERMFDYRSDEIIGQPLDRLLPTCFRARHAHHVDAFSHSGVTTRTMGALGAISGVRANGEKFPIEASISQAEVAGEQLCTVILRDITERKDAETALRRSGEELRALASHFDQLREEQAARIARELHDEFGQILSILKLHVRSLQRQLAAHTGEPSTLESREAEELIEGAVRSVRQLCTELRPPMLDHLGLRPAIEALAADFRTCSGIDYTLSTPDDFPVLDCQRQTAVYRIVQELLTNVARHSGANQVRIDLRVKDAGLEIEVADNGRGITAGDTAGTRSLGLLGMRERVLAVGGHITIAAQPGGGTTGRAHLPFPPPPTTP